MRDFEFNDCAIPSRLGAGQVVVTVSLAVLQVEVVCVERLVLSEDIDSENAADSSAHEHTLARF